MDKIKVVCRALIIDTKRHQVLAVRKTDSDFWCLPGGKLDDNDPSLQDCLARELKEELGITVVVNDIFLVQELHRDNTRYVELIWKAELKNHNFHKNLYEASNKELIEARWVGQNELGDLNIKPTALKTLRL